MPGGVTCFAPLMAMDLPGHESPGVVGFGGLRSGFEVGGAIGEILGVYGQALTEGDLTDGHFSVWGVSSISDTACGC